MARRMRIIRPRPQGRAHDVDGKMIRSGEIGVFSEQRIAQTPTWFEPAPLPKPKPKPKAEPKKVPKKATKKATKKTKKTEKTS